MLDEDVEEPSSGHLPEASGTHSAELCEELSLCEPASLVEELLLCDVLSLFELELESVLEVVSASARRIGSFCVEVSASEVELELLLVVRVFVVSESESERTLPEQPATASPRAVAAANQYRCFISSSTICRDETACTVHLFVATDIPTGGRSCLKRATGDGG